MKNWKVILQSNIFITFFLCIALLLIVLAFLIEEKSIWNIEDESFSGKVIDYKMEGDQLSFTLKGKEKLIVFYTIKTKEEKEILENQIKYGIELKIEGELELPKENTIPNTFNYKKYLYYKHIHYILNGSKIEITKEPNSWYKIKNYITKYLKKLPNHEYYLALILGNTKEYDLTNVRENGVSHLFAVSGMHFSLLVAMLSVVLKKKKVFPQIILLILLIFYAFLVGFTPSVLRALFTYILSKANEVLENLWSRKKIFIIVLLTLLIYDPFFLMDIGFQYSFLISGCFLYLKPEKKYLYSLIKTTGIAFFVSLPITAIHFYEINVLGMIWNLFFVPMVTFLIYPFTILSLFLPFLRPIYSIILTFFEIINTGCSMIKIGTIFIPKTSFIMWSIYYLSLFLYLKKGKKIYKYSFLFFILWIKLLPYFDQTSYIYFLDVGQGDATLLVSPGKKEIFLIDTGGLITYPKESWQEKEKKTSQVDTLKTFFRSIGISRIHYLILTHGDYDHIGNASELVENFKVEKVIFNCGPYNDLEKELIKVIEKKKIEHYSCIKELNIINNKLYFLNTKEYDNENDNSNVIYTELNNYKFLFMGDASKITEEDILKKYKLSNIDVLKVGHHGSKTSSSKGFINTINPKYSIISVGKNNRYGHPNKEALENLNESKIYRTDEYGSIMLKLKKGKLSIETCPP